jgi:hypothetical protein
MEGVGRAGDRALDARLTLDVAGRVGALRPLGLKHVLAQMYTTGWRGRGGSLT